jgi:hypothetical protein
MTNPHDLVANVARSVEAGLDRQVALRALTVTPAEIFGVADRGRVDPDDDGRDDRWGGGWDENQPPPPGIPDPYAGWDDPRHSPQAPAPSSGAPSGSLYRSPDLRARDRAADTGPIPIRPRRDRDED